MNEGGHVYWRRGAAATASLGTVIILSSVTPAQRAHAHGAPWSPISRAAACAPDNERYSDSPACVAAQNASPGGALDAWDNLRRKGVDGNHRSVVPDGELCGAGLDEYQGLNLPRNDWPATLVHEGAEHTFKFLATVPHKGRFTVYITKDGYDPSQPLRWSDLEAEPFIDVTDPELIESSYQFAHPLPAGKKGRHVIFTIWENTTLPDTYYFCSDVLFWGGRANASKSPAPTSGTKTKEIEVGLPGRPVPTRSTPKATRTVPAVVPSGSPEKVLSPVAKAAGLVPGTEQGGLALVLACTIAVLAASVVIVLSFFIRRQGRRSS